VYVYLGGPIDSTEDLEAELTWRDRARSFLRGNRIPTFDPLKAWGGYCPDQYAALSVARIDISVAKEATILLAHFSSRSFGTSVEVGVAIRGEIPVVLWGSELMDATSAILAHPLIYKGKTLQEGLPETVRLWRLALGSR